MPDDFVRLLAARKGHFRYESGHHGDLWLDLDPLFLRPDRLQPFVVELARKLSAHPVEGVCGPLVGGAFLAQLVALGLGLQFYHAERVDPGRRDTLYPVAYRIPDALRSLVRGKKVAVVDDVINAGSATCGTFHDLEACGASPMAIGALLVLGSTVVSFAAGKRIPLECVAHLPNPLWEPPECPLCAARVPLEDPVGKA